VSLETPIGEEEDSHLGDFIPDDDAPAPSEAAAFTLLKEQLVDVLDNFDSQRRESFKASIGLDDGRPEPLKKLEKSLM